jgi:hypothetical protein
MPAGRLQISTSSTHDGGPIQAIGYINDTLKLAQDNKGVGGPDLLPVRDREGREGEEVVSGVFEHGFH